MKYFGLSEKDAKLIRINQSYYEGFESAITEVIQAKDISLSQLNRALYKIVEQKKVYSILLK